MLRSAFIFLVIITVFSALIYATLIGFPARCSYAGFEPDLCQNFEVSLVFFLAEIALVAIILPIVISSHNERKLRPIRSFFTQNLTRLTSGIPEKDCAEDEALERVRAVRMGIRSETDLFGPMLSPEIIKRVSNILRDLQETEDWLNSTAEERRRKLDAAPRYRVLGSEEVQRSLERLESATNGYYLQAQANFAYSTGAGPEAQTPQPAGLTSGLAASLRPPVWSRGRVADGLLNP